MTCSKKSKVSQGARTRERVLSLVPYPTTLAFAVCLDACVDGFLIGIASASGGVAGGAGSNAGVIMASLLHLTEILRQKMAFVCQIATPI